MPVASLLVSLGRDYTRRDSVNTRRRQEAKETVARIAAGVEDSKQILARLDGAISQLETVRVQLDIVTTEMQGQVYVSKERLRWLILELDKAVLLINAELKDERSRIGTSNSPDGSV